MANAYIYDEHQFAFATIGLYQHGLSLITAWLHYKVSGEITHPFPNFNGAVVDVWEWITNSTHILMNIWLLIHAGMYGDNNPC